MEKNYQYNPYAAINACYRFSYGSKHSICRHEDSFELVGNRVTRIGAKQPEVVLLALDLQHLVVCPSQRNGPEVDAPFSSGGGSDRRMATALRLTPAHHQGQRRIVHDKTPNNPASAWAISTGLRRRHCTGQGRSGAGRYRSCRRLPAGRSVQQCRHGGPLHVSPRCL
jgi:hypothetical protein